MREIRDRFPELSELVGRPVDMNLDQWYELYDAAVRFRPDIILEFGRGYGNSTVAFTAAARTIKARVVSISDDTPSAWRTYTEPRLTAELGRRWFRRLTILQGQVQEHDIAHWLGRASRAILFWDAHGGDLADHVIGTVFPLLPRPSLVIVHDVTQFDIGPPDWYGWRDLYSPFEELVAIGAFLDRDGIGFEQWSHMIAFELGGEAA